MQKLTNVSNMAALGVEWEDEDGGRFQLVNPRGTSHLMLGVDFDKNRHWSTVPVTNPGRFLTSPPRNFKEFMVVVEAWFADKPEEEVGA
jgi:hypothetical protein